MVALYETTVETHALCVTYALLPILNIKIRLQACLLTFRLQRLGLAERCERLSARPATDEELQSCHSPEHVQGLRRLCEEAEPARLRREADRHDSVYLHPVSGSGWRSVALNTSERWQTIAGELVFRGMPIISLVP